MVARVLGRPEVGALAAAIVIFAFFYAVAPPFRDYYARHAGARVLGPPITGLVLVEGIAAQYFEKGRIEDHRAAEAPGALDGDHRFIAGQRAASKHHARAHGIASARNRGRIHSDQ